MKIHHIAISVRDLNRSVSFYKENFGFKEIGKFTKPGWDGSAIVLELNGITLEIFGFNDYIEKKMDGSNLKVIGINHFGILIDTVNKKYQELKDKGVEIDEPVKGTTCAWFCFLRDPDGISLELYEMN